MYDQLRRTTQNSEFRRVKITEVNPAKRYVIARDAYDRDYQISFDFHPGVIVIPDRDEIWLIRSYQSDWRLDRKLERNSIETLAPGDKLITTTGEVHIEGDDIYLNGTSLSSILSRLEALESEL